jgi:hypothetical protein
MIERFNFYDIYGYFIPGALLIAVLWAPHGLIEEALPTSKISAALAMVVAAYVAGHMLQIIAAKALPSKELFEGQYRAASDLLFEGKHRQAFREVLRRNLIAAVSSWFELDLTDQKSRKEAFFLCRNRLIAAGTASYAEQFEGMYVMMRGISAASGIGFAYALGWLGSCLFDPAAIRILLVLLFLTSGALWLSIDWETRAWRLTFIAALMTTIICAGIVAAGGTPHHLPPLFAVAALSLAFAILAYGSYHAFTWTWASTVYRHFYLWSQTADPPDPK